MGGVESKVPDDFETLPEAQQAAYRSFFDRLVAAGTKPDIALLELCAIYCAVEDPAAFVEGVDLDGDGKVSAEEVAKLMVQAGASKKDAAKASRAVVRAADVDHDGAASTDELGVYASDAQIRRALSSGGIVIDVRQRAKGLAYKHEVAGALRLPSLADDEGVSFAESLKNLPIVINAEKGRRAEEAIAQLANLGFVNVIHAYSADTINTAVAEGPSSTELADAEDAGQDLVAAQSNYERAGRLAAKAAVVQSEAKNQSKDAAVHAAAAAALMHPEVRK
eukprot:INCI1730.1.p1 GENE.INCI1730.1~~INCI1730.1.p1  ORF type:complete len:314 (+),score=93.80 INCI1730.1:108-944(+)